MKNETTTPNAKNPIIHLVHRCTFNLGLSLFLMAFGPTQGLRASDYPSVPLTQTQPGKIALVYGGTVPKFDLQTPDNKGEAGDTLGRAICLDWWQLAHDYGIQCYVDAERVRAGMILTIPAFVVGGTYGAIVGLPEKKVNTATRVLGNVMDEARVEEALRWQLMFLVWDKNHAALTILTNQFPPESEFHLPAPMDDQVPIPASMALARPHAKLCQSLAEQGFGKLMMIRVINHGLSGKDGHNSTLSVNMTVRVSFIQLADATQRGTFYVEHQSGERKFIEWAANNGEAFREEFGRGLQDIADQISQRVPAAAPVPGAPINLVQGSIR